MATLEKLWIIAKTANVTWASTSADIQIGVTTNYRSVDFKFVGLGEDSLIEGRLYEFECDIQEARIDHRDVTPRRVRMTITSDDAWLPEKFWMLGKTDDGEFHLMGAIENWPSDAWFSTNLADGQASYRLDFPFSRARGE